MMICSVCDQSPKIFRLLKCAGCFKPLCEDCAIKRYASKFCSEACAKIYFFGTNEEDYKNE